MASCPLGLFVTKGPLCMHTSWRVSGIPLCMRAYVRVGNLTHLSYRGILNNPLDLRPCMGDWDEHRAWKLYADAFKEAPIIEKGIMIVLPLVGGIAFYSFLIMIS